MDGLHLPVPYGEDGTVLVGGHLGFGDGMRARDLAAGPLEGTVRYTVITRRPGHPEQLASVDLDYEIRDGVLTINLCPPLALCITTTELIGPVGSPTDELVLTHHIGGTPGSVFRYFPNLPD